MARFGFLDDSGEAAFSDGAETIDRAEMASRVRAAASRFSEEGVAGAKAAVALDAGLGSVATVIAALEEGLDIALLARPPDGQDIPWPEFAEVVILPPRAGEPIENLSIKRLRPRTSAETAAGNGTIWLHSSGSTGTPKWIVHDAEGLVSNARAVKRRMGIGAGDRVLIPVGLHHSYGLGAALMVSLMAGASPRIVPRGNPLALFQAHREFEPTVMFLVPSQARSILALRRKTPYARVVAVGGDRLLAEEASIFEAEYGKILCCYGSTEAHMITACRPDDPPELRHRTVGPVLDGVRIMPRSDDEISTRGDALNAGESILRVVPNARFLGYADGRTGEVVTPAPDVITTGDIVRFHAAPDARPLIEVQGRADHAVKRDGLLVHLSQIETCLTGAAGVLQAAVVPAGRSRRGVGLVAVCAVEESQGLTAEDVLAHSRKNLPSRAVPDRVEFVAELPLLPSGKVDRRALSALVTGGSDTA